MKRANHRIAKPNLPVLDANTLSSLAATLSKVNGLAGLNSNPPLAKPAPVVETPAQPPSILNLAAMLSNNKPPVDPDRSNNPLMPLDPRLSVNLGIPTDPRQQAQVNPIINADPRLTALAPNVGGLAGVFIY